ncbi:MAG: hypothetical protein ACI9ES_002828 [Oceanospirillaceae bacterium]
MGNNLFTSPSCRMEQALSLSSKFGIEVLLTKPEK